MKSLVVQCLLSLTFTAIFLLCTFLDGRLKLTVVCLVSLAPVGSCEYSRDLGGTILVNK